MEGFGVDKERSIYALGRADQETGKSVKNRADKPLRYKFMFSFD